MYRHSFWLLLALVAANASHAQTRASEHIPLSGPQYLNTPQTLSLAGAIAMTLQQNLSLSAARREVEAAHAGIIQAGARPDPEFSALLEDTRKSSRTTTYQISQPIELGGKRDARLAAAQRTYEMAQLQYEARRSEVRAGVRAAYYDVVMARQRQQLATELLTLATTATQMTARRVTAGKISPVEQSRARLAQSGAQLELNQADSEFTLAQRRLAGYWGSSAPSAPLPDDEAPLLPALPAPEVLEERVATGPAVRLARLEVERRQALAEIERSKRVPDVALTLGKKRDEEAARNMWVVGFSMPIPLFDGNRGNQLEALKRVEQARDELALAELRVQGEAAQSVERLRNARQEAQALQDDIIPGAAQAYQAARTGFELGKFGFLDVLDAQRTYFQAKSQYWKALATACQAAAELDRLIGFESSPVQ